MRLFYGFALAFNMMSIIPFFKVHNFFKGINGYSAMFYPLVGFILGLFLWATHALLEDLIPPIHAAVIIFSLWVVLSGALHIDGFSDSVDGLFVQKERALEVMKDSHVGGMGMTFTFVFLAIKLSSVIYLEAFYLLPIILMFSRLNATLAIYIYEYASNGVGKLIKDELTLKLTLSATLYSLVIALVFSSLTLFFISIITLLVSASFFKHRLGGLTGDIYGFIIEVTELALLNFLILSSYS